MPTPYQPLKCELMGTWTSTDNHLIGMGPHDQLDSSFYFNHPANGPILAPATCQTSEIPPLMDLPEWTSLNQYPGFDCNEMWYMPPGVDNLQNVTEQNLIQTGEDLSVGNMDLSNFIDFEPVDSGINWL
ncbi:hypothetical protein NA56DRAFT_168976 [Hyaloscypha hepaticicola]|uniref:Uncharacterized protein n=1 Tax=Hyaloscypha hepaticicola TaxID=2082293 RepID=A0A2J6Q2P4_9HELO|nr:hypothetical protein NA56DRAFT_168976 [Hyaloscypha hepaticicola]